MARDPLESVPTRIRGQRGRQLCGGSIRLLERCPRRCAWSALRQRFPHVLNRIAADWDVARSRFAALIDSLLIDQRGQRQGFPFESVLELTEPCASTTLDGAPRGAPRGG